MGWKSTRGDISQRRIKNIHGGGTKGSVNIRGIQYRKNTWDFQNREIRGGNPNWEYLGWARGYQNRKT
jgi:hypothetical protein